MTSGGRGPCGPTRDIAVQWRSQYGANGAPAPPGLPRTISANRAYPIRFLEG